MKKRPVIKYKSPKRHLLSYANTLSPKQIKKKKKLSNLNVENPSNYPSNYITSDSKLEELFNNKKEINNESLCSDNIDDHNSNSIHNQNPFRVTLDQKYHP